MIYNNIILWGVKMKFNEIIKGLREDKDITQTKLAKIFNTTQRTISNWEVGRNEPPYEMLIKYAIYFNVSTDYILGLTNDPEPRKPHVMNTEKILDIKNNLKNNQKLIIGRKTSTEYILLEEKNGNVINFHGEITIDEKTKTGKSLLDHFKTSTHSTAIKILKNI